MDDNHVFYEHKYGFRQKHSTQQAIITLVNKITTSLDKGEIIISVRKFILKIKTSFEAYKRYIYVQLI